jgi:hypothetical protein
LDDVIVELPEEEEKDDTVYKRRPKNLLPALDENVIEEQLEESSSIIR